MGCSGGFSSFMSITGGGGVKDQVKELRQEHMKSFQTLPIFSICFNRFTSYPIGGCKCLQPVSTIATEKHA